MILGDGEKAFQKYIKVSAWSRNHESQKLRGGSRAIKLFGTPFVYMVSKPIKQTKMIDLNKELKTLKRKAKKLMKLGYVQEYMNTLYEINQVQLKLVSVRS
mgnify:CR=1 FL=1